MTIPSYLSSEMNLGKFPDHTEFQRWIVNFRTEVCSKAMMAAALNRCYDDQTHFWKKISVEEQRAQKDHRFLREKQIAYSIYEYFRPTGVMRFKGLSGLFSIEVENDDIPDFDLRWEQALLLTIDPQSDKVLEGLYVSKLQDSSQGHTIMEIYNQEILCEGRKKNITD